MEVRLVLNVVDFFYKLELHLVIYVQLLIALAHLHLQVVIRLLDLCNVHLL